MNFGSLLLIIATAIHLINTVLHVVLGKYVEGATSLMLATLTFALFALFKERT